MKERRKEGLRSRKERLANEILMCFRGRRKSAQDVYISDPIDTDKDGNSQTLMDIVAQEGDIVDELDLKLKSERLYELIDQLLDERERLILHMRYGLRGRIPMTQREVATKLGISRSYVSRIEKRALLLLRKHLQKEA